MEVYPHKSDLPNIFFKPYVQIANFSSSQKCYNI